MVNPFADNKLLATPIYAAESGDVPIPHFVEKIKNPQETKIAVRRKKRLILDTPELVIFLIAMVFWKNFLA
ncbi:hypothetical protein AC812_02140 [Bellilinea caldifistulae]|uniref:Uncharacterized protein n=1 Tax=Bellilinea caldifistulae TaxID=360411 RepID=A0A0P6XS14_9CHLR|nr:hypothetical protein AC812_02140 [Bellilinea caldifistulae]